MKIFISHSGLDKTNIASPLFEALSSLGHDCWFDAKDISAAASIPAAISKGIQQCDGFIILLSKNYTASPWCDRELNAIQYEVIEKRKRVLFVCIGDTSTMPALFADEYYLRFTFAEDIRRFAEKVSESLSSSPARHSKSLSVNEYVDRIFDADARAGFRANLIDHATFEFADPLKGENEGLLLIKPGGTFYRHMPARDIS